MKKIFRPSRLILISLAFLSFLRLSWAQVEVQWKEKSQEQSQPQVKSQTNFPTKAETEAQMEEQRGGTVVFSTRLLPELKEKSAHTVEVITGEEIQERGDRSVAEAVRNLPGVYVFTLGTRGETNRVRIRGSEPQDVLVLLDGVRVNNPFSDDADLGLIPTELVDRIEVLKGSQAVLYGGRALAGVVAIYTKKGEDPDEVRLSFEAGNLGYIRSLLQYNGKTGPAHYMLGFSRTDLDGQFANDDFHENAATQRWDFDITDKLTMTVTSHLFWQDKGLARGFLIGPAPLYDPTLPPEAFFIQIDRDFNREAKTFQAINALKLVYDWNENYKTQFFFGSLYNSGVENDPAGDNPGVTTPSGLVLAPNSVRNELTSSRNNVDLRQTIKLPKLGSVKQSIIAGFEFYDERVNTFGVTPFPGEGPPPPGTLGPFIPPVITVPTDDIPEGRQNYSPYFLYHLGVKERYFLDAGVRWDYNSAYGGNLSPRVAMAYLIPKLEGKVHGAYGEGYLPPTNLQLFNPITGNPDLKPELSQSYEIGYEQPIKNKATLFATFFYIDFDNLVSRLGENTDDAYTLGVETGFEVRPTPTLSISGYYTFVDSEDETTGQRLPNYPTHTFSGILSARPWRSLRIDSTVLYVSDQLELFPLITTDGRFINGTPAASLEGGTNPGYFLWDLAIAYTFELAGEFQDHPRSLKLYGKVNNLLNNNYEAVFGFPSPGINYFGGMELLF